MARFIVKLIIYLSVLTIVLFLGILIGQNLNLVSNNNITEKLTEDLNNNQTNEDLLTESETKNQNLATSSGINSVQSVKVTRVLDGDTIEIEGGQRVRYLGINAPESGEPFFTEATRENERWVAGRTVKLEFDVQTQDRYQRLLAYVWADGQLVNEEIVRNGYAVSETIQPDVKYQDLILKAEKEAREHCRGLWANLCSSKPDASCIKIVNINADAPGNDNENKNGEWIEIKNTCQQAILMKDWLLKDSSASNQYRFKDFTLEPGQNVLLYSGCGVDSADKLYWQCPEGRYAIWNNTGDHAFLYDNQGNLVSDYQY